MTQSNHSHALDHLRLPVDPVTPGLAVMLVRAGLFFASGLFCWINPVAAQSVCLPAPRLLTTMPMGGCAGEELEVTITGQSLEAAEQLIFSNPSITAIPKLDDSGAAVANQFVVRIAADCPTGVYDARVMAGLGISSPRAFSVSRQPEITQPQPCTTLETALNVSVGSIVNAALVDRSVNHYAFSADQGQRIIVDCVAKGIDSKMNPVLIIADSSGSDLIVERRGGAIDFVAPEQGRYVVKLHDLTFKGGPEYFYRLSVTDAQPGQMIQRMPTTDSVASFSWPPTNVAAEQWDDESDFTRLASSGNPIAIELPCDVHDRFFPAADVDTYQFQATKGDVWWIEVASERLGFPTDPSVVVQRLDKDSNPIDVAEIPDVPSPVKRSSNGYSYDGPPYNAGSSDALGKFEVSEDGTYQIRVTDLFGGTRNDPSNRYRMIVRRAAPDFAIVGWAMHMELRNGDRNALSKPISLRGGAVVPLEIVAVRRDGFAGEINLTLENLPEGVTATGLKIPAGATRGILLIAADAAAPRGLEMATLLGHAAIDGQPVTRQGRFASMKWPVPDANGEIPDPRLVDQFPVSVGGIEQAPLSIEPVEENILEVTAGQTLTLPLRMIRRSPLSGKTMSIKTFGSGFDHAAAMDVSLTDETTQVTLDLAKLKTAPGEYQIAFYGGAVANYGYGDQKPKDIVDLYVSKPISIRVIAAEANKP